MTRIVYIGNFGPPRSTENAVAYGLRAHGCEVLPILQEETARKLPERLLEYAVDREADLVLYTRTHNPTALGPAYTTIWRQLEDRGIQTASYHLDVFVGVRRHGMNDAYRDPLLTTGRVFTPDPRLGDYIANHRYLPPAADVRAGETEPDGRPEYAGKVVFVGSRYGTPTNHPEYPFRAELLDWLALEYGDRFLWFGPGSTLGAPRGVPLWEIYASDCLVVGDSCFAGDRPGYWSDRVPETLARGGLLLHPRIDGIAEAFPGRDGWWWEPGDLGELARRIKTLGSDELAGFRREARRVARETTLAHHTYVHRAREVLAALDLYPEEGPCSPARPSSS